LRSLNKEVVVAGIIINDKNEVLMQLRDDKIGLRARGMWVFPGGHVGKKENCNQALKREIKEETNLQVKKAVRIFEILDVFQGEPPFWVIFYLIYCQDETTVVCGEGQKLEFMHLDQIDNLNVPAYFIKLKELIKLYCDSLRIQS
jgi:mutator protein MutT